MAFIRKVFPPRAIASPRILSPLLMKAAARGGEILNFPKYSTFATILKQVETSDFPIDFPEPPPCFPFTIEDIPGERYVKLRREFGGEKIVADANFGNLVAEVFKGSGKSLEVHFDTYPSIEFEVTNFHGDGDLTDTLSLMPMREGKKFWREFLRVRGIEDCIGQFLAKYMMKRIERDEFLFLEKFRKFLGIKPQEDYTGSCFSPHFCTAKSDLIKLEPARLLDDKLVEILKSKIKAKELSPSLNKKMRLVPADFPFTIQDEPYYIILTRELVGEKIEAKVFLRGSSELIVDMDIFKENGKHMNFNVIMSADNIEIKYIQVKGPAKTGGIWAWRLDDDLVSAYVEFLHIRGIKKSYFKFLHKLGVTKRKRRSIANLKEIKEFMEEQ
ncbi:hypothetical protein ACS0TY_015666 [Phlomoides rotata]